MRWRAASGPKATKEATDDRDEGSGEDIERYEQLRARALAGDGAGWQLGLALLQRRGVLAWSRAWPQQRSATRAIRPPVAVPAAAGPEIVGALASLALARLAA